MKKLTIKEEVIRIRKIMGISENYDIDSDYVDDMSSAKSNARRQQNFNDDAIEYVGGEDEWNRLSPAEQDSILSDIETDWDRSRSMGESEGGLGSSIDERMMDPTNVALRVAEDLPEEYDDTVIGSAIENYIKEAGINTEVADKNMKDHKWWDALNAKISEIKTQGFNESDDTDGELDFDTDFDDDDDSVKISIPLMSALSDIQEKAPELSGRINFIKALIQKMGESKVISTSELNDLENQFG